jgi:hypothetical protein
MPGASSPTIATAGAVEGWVVVSMQDDWQTIFPEDAK